MIVHLRETSGGMLEAVDPALADHAVDVPDDLLARREEAIRALLEVDRELRRLYDAAEEAELAALPEPDPDAPPPGPLRDHFPQATTDRGGITFGGRG